MAEKGGSKPTYSLICAALGTVVFYCLFFGSELVFANAAELAGEIIGKIFPLCALFVFIIDPAAYLAYIFHGYTSSVGAAALGLGPYWLSSGWLSLQNHTRRMI